MTISKPPASAAASAFEFPQYRLLQFAKAPQLGAVKTRMSPRLDEKQCLQLHQYLTRTTLTTLTRSALCPLQLWVGSEPQHPFFQTLAEQHPLSIFCQQGGNLGERMYAAAKKALACAQGVVIVGSDCPFIDADYVRQAIEGLASGCDVVIGPALDGGYVLLALRQADARLFDNISWGSERVLAQTRERLQSMGWHYRELNPLADIDRPEDLALLPPGESVHF